MSRKARIKSSTGIYHVLVRAIANLSLFTDQEDVRYYTDILNGLQQEGRCEIYAYALFPTHVHLLVRDTTSSLSSHVCSEPSNQSSPFKGDKRGSEAIGAIMKRIASAYSYYFNVKYDHYGPIYLDRFKSNPVESKDYYLKVLDHIGSQQTDWKHTTTRIPTGLHPSPLSGGQEGSESHGASLLDYIERPKRITDSRLLDFLQQNYAFTNIGEFLQREIEEQKEVISNCKKIGGSIRQIVRLTGSPYQAVFQTK